MDRSGLAGPDVPTHHGVFDIGYTRVFPNLTVMAPGQEIHLEDLPTDLVEVQAAGQGQDNEWQSQLRTWAQRQLASGSVRLLDEALPVFERTLIDVALQQTSGRRQDAARLLGWGRNTLTRKIKELDSSADKSMSQ